MFGNDTLIYPRLSLGMSLVNNELSDKLFFESNVKVDRSVALGNICGNNPKLLN